MLLPLRCLRRHDRRWRAIQPRDAAAMPATAVLTAAATGSARTADPTTFSARAATLASGCMRDIALKLRPVPDVCQRRTLLHQVPNALLAGLKVIVA